MLADGFGQEMALWRPASVRCRKGGNDAECRKQTTRAGGSSSSPAVPSQPSSPRSAVHSSRAHRYPVAQREPYASSRAPPRHRLPHAFIHSTSRRSHHDSRLRSPREYRHGKEASNEPAPSRSLPGFPPSTRSLRNRRISRPTALIWPARRLRQSRLISCSRRSHDRSGRRCTSDRLCPEPGDHFRSSPQPPAWAWPQAPWDC